MAAQVPAHAWVTTDTGLLKAVNLAKRTATNFYDGAQPSKEEAIKYMTSPTKHSLLTISQNGKVKKFENGKFTLLHESNLENPMFLDSLSSIKLESSVEGDKADTITDSVVHCYSALTNFGPAPKFGRFCGFWGEITLHSKNLKC